MRTDLGLMPLAALLGLGLACGSTSDGAGGAPDARTEAGAGSAGVEGGSGGNSAGGSGGSISASGGMGGNAGSTGGMAGSSDRDGSAAGGVSTIADAAASLDALVPPEDAGLAIRLDANVGGCVPLPDSSFCSGDRPVTWYCENFPVPEEFLSGPCMDAGTALIRYCCPCSFQDVCR